VNKTSRFLIGAATALTLAAGAVAVAAPANAAAPSSCASGASCLWDNMNYVTNGSVNNRLYFVQFVDNLANYKYSNTQISTNDTANSAYNNGNTDAAYYWEDAFYKKAWFTLPKKTGDSDFGNGVPGRSDGFFNNRLSSASFYSIHHP